MVEVALAEGVAKSAWAIIKPFAVFIACALVGFVAAEAWEHSGPRPALAVGPLHWSPFGQSLKTQRDAYRDSIPAIKLAAYKSGAADQFKADGVTVGKWTTAFNDSQADLKAARTDLSAAQSRADAYTSKQASAAYDLGRATCGAPNASTPHPSPGAAVAGGVSNVPDDFAGLFGQSAWTASPGPTSVPGRGD